MLDFHTVSNAGSRGKPSRVCVPSWSVLNRKRIHCASSRGDFFACADPAGTKTNFLFYFSPLMPFLAAKGWITVCSTNKLCECCNMDISVQYKWQKEKKMTLWSFHKVGISCATDTWEATRAHILSIHTVQSTGCTYWFGHTAYFEAINPAESYVHKYYLLLSTCRDSIWFIYIQLPHTVHCILHSELPSLCTPGCRGADTTKILNSHHKYCKRLDSRNRAYSLCTLATWTGCTFWY